jgi:outer membrane protein assembly factor BamB
MQSQSLWSGDKSRKMSVDPAGKIVVYNNTTNTKQWETPTPAAGSFKAPVKACLMGDASIRVSDNKAKYLWTSPTTNFKINPPPYNAIMRADGTVVVANDTREIWSKNSSSAETIAPVVQSVAAQTTAAYSASPASLTQSVQPSEACVFPCKCICD